MTAASLLLSGCAGSGQGTDYCALAEPIYTSRDDVLTEGTAQQILDHNEFWADRCQGD